MDFLLTYQLVNPLAKNSAIGYKKGHYYAYIRIEYCVLNANASQQVHGKTS